MITLICDMNLNVLEILSYSYFPKELFEKYPGYRYIVLDGRHIYEIHKDELDLQDYILERL